MAAASDVPARYDLVLSGGSLSAPVGFVFLDALEPSLPFRTHRAIYGYSPTFIERANTSGSFGDNQQDFFLTYSDKDWSKGEQLKYARPNDSDAAARYWRGTKIDVQVPGRARMRPDTSALTMAAAVQAVVPRGSANNYNVVAASSTNLYEIDYAGAITDRGAHGLGTTPGRYSITTDGVDIYLSGGAGAVGVRKLDGTLLTYSTFSATAAGNALEFLNNTLYGLDGANFQRYDTAGAVTVIFTWKQADGGTRIGRPQNMRAFGGKLLILWGDGPVGGEVWIYDGSAAPSLVAVLPNNFYASHMEVLLGQAFVAGSFVKTVNVGGTNTFFTRPAIFYYVNGNLGVLWQADDYASLGVTSINNIPLYYHPALASFAGGLVFNDDTTGKIMFYDPSSGGIQSIGSYSVGASSLAAFAASTTHFVMTRNSTAAYMHPATSIASSSTITTSLVDFDSSLTKLFRGITVDFDSATDGNGGSVDIAYRVNDVDGSYTTLQSSAVSGTEYILSGITGHAVSVQVTLNRGTSTNGPILKRIYLRGAPILTSYRTGEYVLDCTGDGGRSPRTLRDQTPNPLAGFDSLAQLQIAKASTTPLTVTDRTGTYTGVVESLEAYEEHPGIDDPTRSGEFVVKLIMRGI